MRLTLLEPATATILNTTATKQYLRVNDSTDDTLIVLMEKTAIGMVESWTGYATSPQQWRLDTPGDAENIELPISPVYSVDEIKEFASFTSTGSLLTAGTDYRVIGDTIVHSQGYWPEARAVDGYQIKFTSGVWESGDSRLNNLYIAALRLVAWMYENREEFVTSQQENFIANIDVTKMPIGLKALLNNIGGPNAGI